MLETLPSGRALFFSSVTMIQRRWATESPITKFALEYRVSGFYKRYVPQMEPQISLKLIGVNICTIVHCTIVHNCGLHSTVV